MMDNTSPSQTLAVSPSNEPVFREIAHVPRSVVPVHHVPQHDERVGPILRNEAARNYTYSGDIYTVFQEMEDKDGHYYAVLQSRKQGLLSRSNKLIPLLPDVPLDRAAMDIAERAMKKFGDLRSLLLSVLDALGKGIAIGEIIWGIEDDGVVLPQEVKWRHPGRFTWDEAGKLRRVDPSDPLGGTLMPERKFLQVCFHPQLQNPAAAGLGLRVYWYSWFKRNNLKSWALYNDKFGSPTVVARYPYGSDDKEREQLLVAIESIQQDAGVTMPEGMDIQLLEASRSGNADTYRELAEWCNDEISKVVLGQTLTTSEGRRSGSLALGRVHESIRHEFIKADAAMVECTMQQLLDWTVGFNLGEEVQAPLWKIDVEREDKLASDVELDRDLIGLGLPLSLDYMYTKYGRPRPATGDAIVNYDDRNIFQYHLKFGILTINEVRDRMGLDPVPWGDRPAGESGADSSSGGSGGEDFRSIEQELSIGDEAEREVSEGESERRNEK
jgi:phage gp29-like protein